MSEFVEWLWKRFRAMISKAQGDSPPPPQREWWVFIFSLNCGYLAWARFLLVVAYRCVNTSKTPATTPPFLPHPPTTRAYVSRDLEEWAFSVNGLDVGAWGVWRKEKGRRREN